MLFNSIDYFIFLPLVFIIYWRVFNRYTRLQNLFLLGASYLFYGWWDWRFLSLIFISSAVDFYLGKTIYRTTSSCLRKKLLWTSIGINLGFLGVFKYFHFFLDSFVQLLAGIGIQAAQPALSIILPVGISFYTFQSLSYTIDIYKGRLSPSENPVSFFTFVAFFPQLVAGPIERARNLLPQFETPRVFSYSDARSGGILILVGLYKKIVIADNLAILVDAVYSSPASYPGFPMVLATLFFTFQIYCDFSGYSDIAIGTARLLGINLNPNFNTPYFSSSLTEFWHRWHISLSSWFRDYVYIPLGGNRTTRIRRRINLFATFVLSGLWHGANWTFVIWGALHGSFLIIEKTVWNKTVNHQRIITRLAKTAITFGLVSFAWIFFRSNQLSDAYFIITNMFSDIRDYTDVLTLSLKFRGMGLKPQDLVMATMFLLFLISGELIAQNKSLVKRFHKSRGLRWCFYYSLLFAVVFSAARTTASNFIYFQF